MCKQTNIFLNITNYSFSFNTTRKLNFKNYYDFCHILLDLHQIIYYHYDNCHYEINTLREFKMKNKLRMNTQYIDFYLQKHRITQEEFAKQCNITIKELNGIYNQKNIDIFLMI